MHDPVQFSGMKKIIAVDLDGTLIRFDSLRRYMLKLMFKSLGLFAIITINSFLRIFNLISISAYVGPIVKEARLHKDYQNVIADLADIISKHLDLEILEKLRTKSTNQYIKIISTGSPVDYVQIVAKKIGFECMASDFNSQGIYVSNRGSQKLVNLEKTYPRSEFIYDTFITDNRSDLYLKEYFQNFQYLSR